MAISFSSPAPRGVRNRGTGVTAVLGPTNTGKTHLAIERMLAHSSGVIGLPLRLLAREVYNKVAARVGAENVALITGEEKIKPPNPRYLGGDRRSHAARARHGVRRDRRNPARRRHGARPRLHRPHAQAPRPRGDAGAGRRHHAADGREAAARRQHRQQAAAVAIDLRRRPQAVAAAPAHGDRHLLDRRSVRHRRIDPASARRRRGGARLAVAAHPQCAGRALSVGRRRLSGRDRRDRHGAQSRCRSCRLRRRPQVRRLSIPQAQSSRARADRRPRRARPAATARSAPPGAARRSKTTWCARWRVIRSSRCGCCNGAIPSSTSPRSARCRPRCR